MELLELLHWMWVRKDVSSQDYAMMANISPNHASKDLSRGFKMGFLKRHKNGKFYRYDLTMKGILYFRYKKNEEPEKLKEIAEQEDDDREEQIELYEENKELRRKLEDAKLFNDILNCMWVSKYRELNEHCITLKNKCNQTEMMGVMIGLLPNQNNYKENNYN